MCGQNVEMDDIFCSVGECGFSGPCNDSVKPQEADVPPGCVAACARTDAMSALCFNDASRRTSEQSLSAILEDCPSNPTHSGNPESSASPPVTSSSPSDRFADAPFDYSTHASKSNFPITASLHESVSHPYAHANVEWSASHYRRQALEEMMKEERRRRRYDRSGHADSMGSIASSSMSLSAGRIPELIGGARGDAHGRNESWASTVSGSSISTTAGAAASMASVNESTRSRFDAKEMNKEGKQEFLLGPDPTFASRTYGYGFPTSDSHTLDMNAFSLESYEKQGVPGSSGPKRFKLGMRNRSTSDGTGLIAQEEQGCNVSMPGASAGKGRKLRRPSFVLREVGSQGQTQSQVHSGLRSASSSSSSSSSTSASASTSIGNDDMKDVLDEIIRMEKGFSLESDKEVSEEERDPLYGKTSVRSNRYPASGLGKASKMDDIPATPMAGVERARELTMQPPPAPKAAGAYATDDTPLPLMRPVSVTSATTPSHQLGHLPSKSLSSLLLPPKDYPEGNWELSPGSGHPTKVRSRPTSVSISGNHRHLRGLSSGQDVLDAIMGQQGQEQEREEDVVTDLVNGGVGKEKRMSRMSREFSPESQARGHKIRRSLTFENTPTGPRFPSGVILGSGGTTPKGMGMGMSLDTPPSAWDSSMSMSSSRRARGKKVLDDSVTRFQFPLRLDTDMGGDGLHAGRPEIKIEGVSGATAGFLAAAHQLDTSDLLTPTQSQFDGAGSDYLTPVNRSSGLNAHTVGTLEPSLFPPTPGKSFAPAGQDHAGLGSGIRFGGLLNTGTNDDQDMEF
jgi:hypothetical protein